MRLYHYCSWSFYIRLGHVDIGWLVRVMGHLPTIHVLRELAFPHLGIGPTVIYVSVNVEYVSERFGLLVIITCGESLFAAVAILQQSDSVKKMLWPVSVFTTLIDCSSTSNCRAASRSTPST